MILKDSKLQMIDITMEELRQQIIDHGILTVFGAEANAVIALMAEYYRISGNTEITVENIKNAFSTIPSAPKKKIKVLKATSMHDQYDNIVYEAIEIDEDKITLSIYYCSR